jgi:hypothetical protein
MSFLFSLEAAPRDTVHSWNVKLPLKKVTGCGIFCFSVGIAQIWFLGGGLIIVQFRVHVVVFE